MTDDPAVAAYEARTWGYVCSRCQNDKHAKCVDLTCACCAGNSDDE